MRWTSNPSENGARRRDLQALQVLAALALVPLAGLGGLSGCRAHRGRDYAVRGKVAQVAVPGQPGSAFMIAHEAVDGFVDRDGERSGMDPMTMSFPLAKGVSPAGLAVGDPIEFTLHVDWTADPPVEITRLRRLPPGTAIVFRAARPGR